MKHRRWVDPVGKPDGKPAGPVKRRRRRRRSRAVGKTAKVYGPSPVEGLLQTVIAVRDQCNRILGARALPALAADLAAMLRPGRGRKGVRS